MAAKPVYANVAFFRIPGFDGRPVADQASLKERLEARLRESVANVGAADRVVLDAEDGAALVLFNEPSRALAIARSFNKAGEDAVQVGLNHGPLALSGAGADARVFGDGLTSAAAAARFATAGRMLVTQDFARALERRDPALAAQLATAGDFTDTRVRQRSFYTPEPSRASAYRRRMLAYAVFGSIAILALGLAAREAAKRLFPPPPAIVKLNVKPRGEVYVDGVYRGRIPPLTQVEVVAGMRSVEIRNPGFAPYQVTLDLKPGMEVNVAHTFVRPPSPKRPEKEPNSFWENLKRKFGS
jgi:hypothetical protein